MRKFVFVVVMMPALASGAVYKCTDASGKVTFSDRSCAGGDSGTKLDIKVASGRGEQSDNKEDLSPEQRRLSAEFDKIRREINKPRARTRHNNQSADGPCKSFSDSEIRTMIIRNQVVVGMKASDASRAWGTPWRVNGSQHAYHWEKGSAYFYTEGGCVRAVQGSYVGGKFVR